MHRKPDLFVIGAMKSGTSSLCNYLGAHPDVFMTPVKEPMHFSRPENYAQGDKNYLLLFAEAMDEIYVGEGSTEYTKRPFREGVAQRLYEFNSSARLIYIMRDPFERIVSQYKHMIKIHLEVRKLSEIIESENDFLTNSYYAYQLKPYLEIFGRDALYLDTFEALATSPVDFCKRLFHWLEINESIVPSNISERFNESLKRSLILNDNSLSSTIIKFFKRIPFIDHSTPRVMKNWLKRIIPGKRPDFESVDFLSDIQKAKEIVNPILWQWIRELEDISKTCYENWPSAPDPNSYRTIKRGKKKLWLPKDIRTNKFGY